MRHLPNIICLIRIVLIVPIVQAIWAEQYWLALVLVAAAAVSDGLDGFLAKRFNWTSELGKFLDPLADKLLLVSIFIVATWMGLLPWWLAAVAIARDVMLGLGALLYRLIFGELRGKPTALSKINTGFQLAVVLGAILHAASGLPPREVVEVLTVATLVTTVISGADYMLLFARRAMAA
jgi:cardiolipin synthase (CMP-forming)